MARRKRAAINADVYTSLFAVKPPLHDTTGCQPAASCKQTSNRLSIRLSNGFDNRFDNRVERTALFVQPVVKPGCTTGLTTGCRHDTAVCQTGCQTGWQRVWQPVVSCKRGFKARRCSVRRTLSHRYGAVTTRAESGLELGRNDYERSFEMLHEWDRTDDFLLVVDKLFCCIFLSSNGHYAWLSGTSLS